MLTVLTLAGTGTPVFILGLLLLMAVCAYLQWLPFPTYVPLGEDPEQWAWNMLLPRVTLGVFESAKYARLTRSSTLETLAEDHIRTFRAYGVAERAVVTRHAVRGAVAPVIALSAVDFGTMIGGAVLTESLFGIPGLGKTLIEGVRVVDLPVVVGVVMAIGTAVVVAGTIADPLRAAGERDTAAIRTRVEELLRRVGLEPGHYDRYPHEFSGGQRQRVGIARALAPAPRLIVCDEPVSALDVTTQAQVTALLAELQRESGIALVFIAHDLAVVRQVSDRVAVMRGGEVVEEGPVDEVYDRPAHAYTRRLLAAVPALDPGLAAERRTVRREVFA
ncbi:ABC transporter permease subunit [Streptomyces sp. NPDC058613]|uniref:ABC transporter permease subunit n=1 Tax=Streptomyces sp. NPDC058613 TaxID=3346556 RepID=UPI00365FF437